MSRRYAVLPKRKPHAGWDDDYPLLPSLSVDSNEPVDTGLVTITGESIMRLPEPMGFHHPEGEA